MSGALERLLGQRKLVLTAAVLLTLAGLASWLTMNRQEDPQMASTFGQVVATFPGADAETVERLILDPLEEELGQVEEIDEIEATARAEVASLRLELYEGTDDTDQAWDRVRDALERARRELPAGAGEVLFDDRLIDQESMVYGLLGAADPETLAAAAKRLEDELLAVPGVSRVLVIADPGDQITIELDDGAARRLGLDPGQVVGQLAGRSRILPGGSLKVGDQTVTLRPRTEFESLEEIRATPVTLASGEVLPLGQVARVRRGPREPLEARMTVDGERSVGVAVIPERGVHLVDLGEAVRSRVAELAPSLAPVTVREVIFQPDRVRARLDSLSRSLLSGALIVAGVVILFMGLRPGLVTASVVPMVLLAAIGLYALGGGLLHQISVAALVIALGILVDNAIVVVEGMQYRLDRGEPAARAARGAVRELAVPLAGATATTIAAFMPMLLAEGATADFTRAIPVVIILTLTLSYLFAVTVTPALGTLFLRPRALATGGEGRRDGEEDGAASSRLARRLGGLAVRAPGRVLLGALAVVVVSLLASGWVRQEFFPSSDRNQFVVEVELPEGSHLDATSRVVEALEESLLDHPEVTSVASFAGQSAPHFYYNLQQVPRSPHYAQMVVDTTSTDTVDPVMAALRRDLETLGDGSVRGAQVVLQKLEQGPPVEAPVVVRLYGSDLEALDRGATALVRTLREIPGTADVRHDLSSGAPVVSLRVDDAAAARRGLDRTDVARALFGATRGLAVGELRTEDDPIPVVVRSPEGEELSADALATLDVGSGARAGGIPIPLGQVARLDLEWRPAAIHHRDRRRAVTVTSQLAPGASYSQVLDALGPRLEDPAALGVPEELTLEIGGAAEGSEESNAAMGQTLPVGVLLLVGILMAEFRSFRRLAIVLVTVPLAASGIVPGLLLGDQPFGFMSLLGVIALVGVVVNNAIVLLEVIEARRAEGAPVPEALQDAVERRVRPILLTAATTTLGLLPLALSPTTLWPPLAWAVISGLIASTFLTLLVVPALYRLLFEPGAVLPPGLGRLLGRLGSRWRSPGEEPAPDGEPRGAVGAGAAALLMAALLLAGAPAVAQATGSSVEVAPVEAAPVEAASMEEGRGTLSVSLAEAMERARRAAAPAVAARLRAEAAGHGARAEARAARWPVLGASASVTLRDRAVTLTTPVGDFPLADRHQERLGVEVSQPLWDLSRRRWGTRAAREEARGAASLAGRAEALAATRAAQAWLEIRALDERREATRAFMASLDGRLRQTEAEVRAGRALTSDGLKVRLARDRAGQELLALEEARRVALLELGRLLGEAGPVEPEPGGGSDGPFEVGASGDGVSPEVREAQLVARALEGRADLAALVRARDALELRRRAVEAEDLPRLDATARWSWADGDTFTEGSRGEVGLAVVWNPFAAGTRAPRSAALAAEVEALDAELADARWAVAVEVRRALADQETAASALAVGETGVEQAAETLRVERARFEAGRLTVNDLLAAEAALRDETTRRELARLELTGARVRLALALGLLDGAPEMIPPEAEAPWG